MPGVISCWKLVKQNAVVYLWLTLDHAVRLCNRQWYAVKHDALQPAYVTTVTSTVRLQQRHQLCVILGHSCLLTDMQLGIPDLA